MEFRPSIEDRIKISETVNYYFEGMKKGKSEIIRKLLFLKQVYGELQMENLK